MRTLAVIIAGSRDYNNYEQLKHITPALIKLAYEDNYDVINIISGGARGADMLGERFARENNYQIIRKLPNWSKWGKSAGYRRNCDMAIEAKKYDNCLCIAYSVNNSKGTEHMINICKKYGVPCFKVEQEETSPTGVRITPFENKI